MLLHRRYPDREKRFAFDGEWARYVLRLREGEYACYSLYDVTVLSKLEVACCAGEPAVLEITQDGKLPGAFDLSGTEHRQILSGLPTVFMDQEAAEGAISSVIYESYACGRMAAERVRSFACRGILWCAIPAPSGRIGRRRRIGHETIHHLV